MSEWTETAKRMVAHPRWEPDSRMAFYTTPDGEQFPDLTDWATTGIILGTVEETVAQETGGVPWDFGVQYWETQGWIAWNYERGEKSKDEPSSKDSGIAIRRKRWPGQALGELWLELVGEA